MGREIGVVREKKKIIKVYLSSVGMRREIYKVVRKISSYKRHNNYKSQVVTDVMKRKLHFECLDFIFHFGLILHVWTSHVNNSKLLTFVDTLGLTIVLYNDIVKYI